MDFPIISALLLDERFKVKFETSVVALNEGIQRKHVWNVDYEDAKHWLGRVWEEVSNSLYNQYYPCGGSEIYRTWSDNDPRHNLPVNQLSYAPGYVKKLKAVKKAPELKPYLQALEEAAVLAELLKTVKPFIVKGRKPSENPVEKDVTNTGICPVCMKRQKLTFDSTLVAHGYTRPRDCGHIGMCMGHDYKAWELSPDGAIAFKSVMETLLKNRKQYLTQLQGSEMSELRETVQIHKTFGRYESEERVYLKGSREYERRRETLIYTTESAIHHLTTDIEEVTERITNWKAQPLMYGGAETQERWKSRLKKG
jgi:hypothetical protein